jgi:uncharacterized surface protein with fasciclin (FAS1) repeats
MKRLTLLSTALAFVGGALLTSAPLEAQDPQVTVMTTAEQEGFTRWHADVRAAGLEARLGQDRPYTVFAPTDDAYAAMTAADRTRLQEAQVRRDFVGHTVVEGRLTAEDLRGREYVTTIDGRRLPVRTEGDRVYVGNALVQRADVAAGPGVIHGVDRVTLAPARAAVRK